MKISHQLRTAFIVLTFTLMVSACKKDDGGYHQISAIETLIHNRINDYRETQGLNRLVLQPIMFEEARVHSDRMANGAIDVGGEGIDQIFADIKDKIGGTTEGWVVFKTFNANADSIVFCYDFRLGHIGYHHQTIYPVGCWSIIR